MLDCIVTLCYILNMYSIEFTRTAAKQLSNLSTVNAKAVRKELEKLAVNPFTATNVKKMAGEDAYRLRVGDNRVIFTIEKGRLVIVVIKIGKRGDVYKH